MQIKGLHQFNLWLEKKLFYPGCTNRQLQGNITVFENHIFLAIYPLMYTIGLSVFAPEQTIYIHYSIAFSILYTLSLSLQLIFPKHHLAIHVFISSTMHLITFYTIIKLGGIPTSGGLIFAGISNVLATVPRQRTWLPILMFLIFSVWVVLLVVLQPWLKVPYEIKPILNSILWMVQAIFLTGAALVFVLRFIRQQRRLEELESSHLKEINEFKDRFFTNITHEFRTPLTIIEGMANLIRARPEKWMVSGLKKITTNSRILLGLVNQMLHLAKAEAGSVSLNFVRRDVNKYLAYLVEQYSSEAFKKSIDLKFVSTEKSFEMDFDPEKMMHIITNLVSNALKYTPEGGWIEVVTSITDDRKNFSIKVRDTGIGIEKEHIKHLFDRFYMVENQLSAGGTGIGLALTKEMVQLLKGTISVESMKGKGSEFTVILPITQTAQVSDIPGMPDMFKVASDYYENIHPESEAFDPEQYIQEILPLEKISLSKLPLLLIVEDNADVVLYLQAILKYEYRIEVAGNGDTGLKKALELVPDIILSDIMMPVMDGIELLVKVKNDMRTSHIPVVMLTAKADIDSRLAGLERGADAYLAKPVDEKELHIQLKNLVELRKKLFERYTSLENFSETSDISIRKEDEFMLKVRKVLENNIEDDEFGISKLCSVLAISHAQLYRKFKYLSNITIADYFKSIRLNKARELLLKTNLNVTEVTYATGFKSLSYFSREFTRKFGKSPSELRK